MVLRDVQGFTRRRPSGWSNTMHVVPLGDGETLIHSPTFIDEQTMTHIEALGTPRVVFAPNHFHHLSLGRYQKRFPSATVAASSEALPRLRARGHEVVQPIDVVSLPSGVRWLVPEGTKNGEAWLSVDGEGGPTWLVCDAFFNETGPVRGVEGALLRFLDTAPALCLGATFKHLCLRDKQRYRAWALDALQREKPRRVLFSHGDPLDQDVTPRLTALLNARLG